MFESFTHVFNNRINCDGAEKSEICPDGTDISVLDLITDIDMNLIYEIPSLVNVTMSTYENSFIPCYWQQTGAIVCEDFIECNQGYLVSNGSTICCQGFFSCSASINITTTIDTVENTIALRCDGHAACSDVVDLIWAKNGGDIYFAGKSFSDVESGTIQTTTQYDIYCTATTSCAELIIKNCNNLYCNGYSSCSEMNLIENVNKIWFYGEWSGYESIITNIGEDIYCGAYQACYSTIITNVANDVYGNGYQVLYDATITDIGGIVYGIGHESLSNVNIRNSTNVCNHYNRLQCVLYYAN